MHTPNNVLNHTWISICVYFVSNYYSYTSSNWNTGGWVDYVMHCMSIRLQFLYGKINYILRTEFFMHQSIVLAIKWVEIVSDRMAHRVMGGCRSDLVLIVHAPTANINYDSKDNFCEEFEQVFDHFPTYHMQILLGCRKAKSGKEDLSNTWENVRMQMDSAPSIYRLHENLWFI
jgi:hypothetical protein